MITLITFNNKFQNSSNHKRNLPLVFIHAEEMMLLLLLSLCTSSLSGLPVTGDETCLALESFQKSLKDAVNQENSGESPLCEGSQPMSKNFIYLGRHPIYS